MVKRKIGLQNAYFSQPSKLMPLCYVIQLILELQGLSLLEKWNAETSFSVFYVKILFKEFSVHKTNY